MTTTHSPTGAQTKLLPCPFCGEEAHVHSGSGWYGVGCDTRSAGVMCFGYCHARQYQEPAVAIRAWNRRALARAGQQAGDELAELREKVRRYEICMNTAGVDSLYDTINDLRAQLASAQKDAERLEVIYQLSMVEPFIAPIATKEAWLTNIDKRVDAARAQITNTTATENDRAPCTGCGIRACNGECMGE